MSWPAGHSERAFTNKAQTVRCIGINSFKEKTVEATVEKKVLQKSNGKNIFHAVTENFLHAEFESEKKLKAGSVAMLKIISALEDSIKCGREEECSAELLK